eukprot:1175642-Prorocentrum_minimum.AAC.1
MSCWLSQPQKLAERVQRLREEEVDNDRVSAHNWRIGRCKQRTLVVLEEYVRKVKLVGDAVALGKTRPRRLL